MVQKWIKPVESADVVDGKDYFVAARPRNSMQGYSFQSIGLNGKVCFSSKPGIAMWFKGGDALREQLEKLPTLVALEIPADAHTRWKARQRRSRW